MDSQSLNFLEQFEEEKNKINTLHMVVDGKVQNQSIEEIFDNKKFEHFVGVTYSVSLGFVNTYLKDFTTCEIVIGIDNESVKNSINRIAKQVKNTILQQIQGEPIKFYEKLNTESKFKLDRGNLKILVSSTHIIHSKFYLLWNENGENRLVLGSSNLSKAAFDKESFQFENVIILNNSDLFETYSSYYKNDLSKVLSDYIPKELKKNQCKEI